MRGRIPRNSLSFNADFDVEETWELNRKHRKRNFDKPFIAWDGEGITYREGDAQSYVLFGNSAGQFLTSRSLTTKHCLDLLLYAGRTNPDAIHVGFALGYDFNMILRDLSERHLWKLYRRNSVMWEGYVIRAVPGKWLYVRPTGKDAPRGIKLYDVFGFFQSSFVKACEKFLGADDPELVGIREGKLARSSFTFDQLQGFIIPYWQGELRLLVRLMDSLRTDLISAGLPLAQWHGPGAVANKVFRLYNVKYSKSDEIPKEVSSAARFAYAGGRFELFRCGHYPGSVWQYDINSAYPAAITRLPNLSAGSWRKAKSFEPGTFGIWRVTYKPRGFALTRPQPLFYRDQHGGVSYPSMVTGWYWTPEAETVPGYVTEGWVFDHDPEDRPFDFVEEFYERRRQWKDAGNSAERALKLALNSLYGKMAQRSGWKPGSRIPTWHQLEWAGYVTSTTRAKLWSVIGTISPASLVAVETDAVFTTSGLTESPSLSIGGELGEWEETRYDWITYLQSGMYWASGGVEKYRGFDKGSIPHEAVMEYLTLCDKDGWDQTPLEGRTTRFVGLGMALRTSALWRSWVTEPRTVRVGGGGKRAHVSKFCSACRKGLPIASNLHPLVIATVGGESCPHTLPWLEEEESVFRLMEEIESWT